MGVRAGEKLLEMPGSFKERPEGCGGNACMLGMWLPGDPQPSGALQPWRPGVGGTGKTKGRGCSSVAGTAGSGLPPPPGGNAGVGQVRALTDLPPQ